SVGKVKSAKPGNHAGKRPPTRQIAVPPARIGGQTSARQLMVSDLPERLCRGPIGRRTWLKIGGLNLGALALGLQPSLRGVLAAAERTVGIDKDFSVILFWA